MMPLRQPPPKDIEAYLARVDEPARTTLTKLRATICSIVPSNTTEAISYGMPAFKYNGPLVGYAAFRGHCSFFPMSGTFLAAYEDDLKNYRTSKGAVQFPVDKPLPAALVKKLVKARIAENESKSR